MSETAVRDGRSTPAGFTVLVALVVVVGSQLLRVMITIDAWWLRGEVGTIGVIPYAFGPFLIAFGAGLLARDRLLRPAVAVAAVVLVVARIAEQISRESASDLWISTVGTSAFLLLLPLLAVVDLRRFGIGLLTGIAADVGIKGALRTLDLSWMDGALPLAAAAALATATAVACAVVLALPLRPSSTTARHTWSVVALGPILFLIWQVLASPGWVATQTGWGPEAALALVLGGSAMAIWAAGRAPSPASAAIAAIIVVIVGFAARWTSPWFGLLALAGLVAVGVLVGSLTNAVPSNRTSTTTAAVAAGNLVMVILLFAFYTTLDLDLPFRQPAVLAAAGILAAGVSLLGIGSAGSPMDVRAAASGAAALLVIPAVLWLTRVDRDQGPPGELTVMSYNIAQGIALGGQLDPEGIARIVEESGATVVGFQEISRSYLLTGGTDLAWWLSHRLGLPFDYGWAEDGGNATLTRFPIQSSELHELPLLGTPQQRTVLITDIGRVLVLNTHLTQRVSAGISDEEKEDDYATVQIPQLEGALDAWSGRTPAVLVGDLNLRPHWKQYRVLIDGGFVDGWEAGTGPGFTTEDEGTGHRIDYVFHTPDLDATNAFVVDTGASLDHLPVVVEFGTG